MPKITKWDAFQGRFELHIPNHNEKPYTVIPANGYNIWSLYTTLVIEGDRDDHDILNGIVILRALFSVEILEKLTIESMVLPDRIVYKEGTTEYVYLPSSDGSTDMIIMSRNGWRFEITVKKEGR